MLSGIAALFLTIARPFIAEQKTLRRERRITADRVQVVGGWSNIVGECRYLYSKTPREGAFYYSGKGQDFLVPLPNSIAALKPDVVEIHPTEYGARVFVQMFGRPDTDRYIPFYGFFVECSTNADQASIPTFQHRQGYVEKIADSVFEIY